MFYLYKKTHIPTNMKYLGYIENANPHLARGDGKYWVRHLQLYCKDTSKEVVTEILWRGQDLSDVTMEMSFYIDQWGISGDSSWANMRNELELPLDIVNGITLEKASESDLLGIETDRIKLNKIRMRVGIENYWYGRSRSGVLNPRYGVPVGPETRAKISAANLGRKPTAEAKEKMRAAQVEIWSSEELREARSLEYKERGIRPPSPRGLRWYNDGTVNMRSREHPGEGWVSGRYKKRDNEDGLPII